MCISDGSGRAGFGLQGNSGIVSLANVTMFIRVPSFMLVDFAARWIAGMCFVGEH